MEAHPSIDAVKRARAGLRYLGFGLLLGGCTAQHTAQNSDTATNWLARCEQHSDCHGAASCVAQLCSVSCTADAAQTCLGLSPSATCEAAGSSEAVCDQLCADDAACTALGVDYHCSAGHCRPDPSASAASLGKSMPESDILSLGDIDLYVASAPVVEWRKDHWTITWLGGDGGWTEHYPSARGIPTRRAEARLNVVEVSADAALLPRSKAFTGQGELHQGGTGQVALFAADPWSANVVQQPSCAFSVIDTDTLKVSSVHNFGCPPAGARADITPVPGSEDWLVVWSTSHTGALGDIMLARYRSGDSGFRAGPWTLATQRQHGALSLGAVDGDAWVAWPEAGSTAYARMSGVAQKVAQRDAGELARGASTVSIETARYAFAPTPQGAQLLYTTTKALQSTHIDNAMPEIARDLEVTQSSTNNGTSSGIEVSALRIPERGVTVICYPQSAPNAVDSLGPTTLSIVTVDDEGQSVAGPQAVSDSAQHRGCAMAWSGHALMVTWWENNAYGAESAYSAIRARIVQLP